MKEKEKAPRQRNLLHDHPLLRKGGRHEKSRKAERRARKVAMRREWDPRSALSQGAAPVPLAA